jgi:hypothetical protein
MVPVGRVIDWMPQEEPVQCSISGCVAVEVVYCPTEKHDVEPGQAVPSSSENVELAGTAEVDVENDVPLNCSSCGAGTVGLKSVPAAKQSVEELQPTPSNSDVVDAAVTEESDPVYFNAYPRGVPDCGPTIRQNVVDVHATPASDAVFDGGVPDVTVHAAWAPEAPIAQAAATAARTERFVLLSMAGRPSPPDTCTVNVNPLPLGFHRPRTFPHRTVVR